MIAGEMQNAMAYTKPDRADLNKSWHELQDNGPEGVQRCCTGSLQDDRGTAPEVPLHSVWTEQRDFCIRLAFESTMRDR